MNVVAIREAIDAGLAINASCESLAQADRAMDLGIPAVAVVPSDAPVFQRSPAGRPVVVCPAQYRDSVTCKSCKLCANVDRPCIVAFRAHGARAGAAEGVIADGK